MGPDADPIDAHSIDQAVWSFGMALQGELDAAEANQKHDRGRKAARERVMMRWLPDLKNDTRQHRDPVKDNPEGLRR